MATGVSMLQSCKTVILSTKYFSLFMGINLIGWLGFNCSLVVTGLTANGWHGENGTVGRLEQRTHASSHIQVEFKMNIWKRQYDENEELRRLARTHALSDIHNEP